MDANGKLRTSWKAILGNKLVGLADAWVHLITAGNIVKHFQHQRDNATLEVSLKVRLAVTQGGQNSCRLWSSLLPDVATFWASYPTTPVFPAAYLECH